MTATSGRVHWDDEGLRSSSDSPRTAKYRAHQSRWRETVLGLQPGDRTGGGNPVGNMLRDDAPRHAQWLTSHIASFADHRIDGTSGGDATIETHRLQRNLLSSMPLCFNIFGQFDAYREAAARTLNAVLPWSITGIREVRVEYAPPLARAELGDATAFDAFVHVDTPDGPAFLAVETKYTEPFSPKQYPADKYRAIAEGAGGWFREGKADAASAPATNQLWRNTMLAQLTAKHYPAYGAGRVVVLTLRGDKHAEKAVKELSDMLTTPSDRLHHVTLEDLVTAAGQESDLALWARLFAARYLPD